MSASTTAYKFYAVVMIVLLVGAGYWLKTLENSPWENAGPPSNEPAKAAAPPPFERFPFERDGGRVVSATITRKDSGTIPVLWLTGTGVLVRKVAPEDLSLTYERTVIRKAAMETLLGRLLDEKSVDAGSVHVTFSGKDETRTVDLVDTKTLFDAVASALPDAAWKPANIREFALSAKPAQTVPESGPQPWPVRRLPLRRIVTAGEYSSRDRDTNRLLQKQLTLCGFYRLEDQDYVVTARPVMP